MRNRAWRRYVEERIVVRRLKRVALQFKWFGFEDANRFIIKNPRYIDYLGTKSHFLSKTITTDKWDSKNKIKYSPNRSKGYYRDSKLTETREYRKKEFIKILKQNGII